MTNSTAFDSILFPVDFSSMSEATANHVAGFAQLTGAPVTLLHVLPWLSAWYGEAEVRPAVFGDQGFRKWEEAQSTAAERFRKRYLADTPGRTCVRAGAVAETITDVAKELETDLIMMPTRGLGRSRPFLIGSTTAKVLHDAPCAVWTSPHLDALHPFAGVHHLLCTIDQNSVFPSFLTEAVRLASYLKAQLSFVAAVSGNASGTSEEQRIRTLEREFLEATLQNLNGGSGCTVYVQTGAVGEVVRRVVDQHHTDLVLTNRGHLRRPHGKFDSHTYEIVLDSPCPVLNLCISAIAEPSTKLRMPGQNPSPGR